MDKDAVLIATALGGGLVTIAMGLFVNYPIALAPGVGLLAFYSFTVVLGMGVSWQTALGAVFISGSRIPRLNADIDTTNDCCRYTGFYESRYYRWYWAIYLHYRFKTIRFDGDFHQFIS